MRSISKATIILGAVLLACGLSTLLIQQNKSLGQQYSVEMKAFSEWATEYSRNYQTPEEKNYRFKIFSENLMTIRRHQLTKSSYTVGLNSFADLSTEEFKAKISGPFTRESLLQVHGAQTFNIPDSLGQVPTIDWRRYLQQQSISTSRNCNSNYAWISAVNMNANYYIKHSVPSQYSFSPQTYIDCSANFGNSGCNGGNPMNSYSYSQNWGIDTMQNYPYYDRQGPCTSSTGFFKNSGVYKVSSLSNTELYKALAARNVITVLIDISGAQFYTGGVFTGPCTTTVNHALLLVGAGIDKDSGNTYWSVLNTWGSSWGELGYMRIKRFTIDGSQTYSSCGLNMYAHFPTFQ